MGKILSISLKLNFTPNTLGCWVNSKINISILKGVVNRETTFKWCRNDVEFFTVYFIRQETAFTTLRTGSLIRALVKPQENGEVKTPQCPTLSLSQCLVDRSTSIRCLVNVSPLTGQARLVEPRGATPRKERVYKKPTQRRHSTHSGRPASYKL